MEDWEQRTEKMFGKDALARLHAAHVAVFGLGGVGGYCVEALARSGIGALTLVDRDKIDVTNLNRQILATRSTVGRYKTEVAAERVAQINPACAVETHTVFVLPESVGEFDFSRFDYVVDAIDTVSGKIAVILAAKTANVPVISAMGAGNKFDATAFRVKDLFETSVCPLARVMRRELRKRGIDRLKTVCSEEEPVRSEGEETGKRAPGSNAFVPAVAGLVLAGEVVKDIIAENA